MKIFQFQCHGFSGSIEGMNGCVMKDANKQEAIAESCTLQIVQDDSFKTWKQCIKKDDLGSMTVEDMVSAINNAVNDDTTTISITLDETCSGDLSMVLSFEGHFHSIPMKFCLQAVEQDELSIMKQRMEKQEEKIIEIEKELMKKVMQQEEELQKITQQYEQLLEKKEEETTTLQQQLELLRNTMEQQDESMLEKMKQQEEEIIENKKKQEESIQKMTKQYEELLEKKKKDDKRVDKIVSQVRKFVDCGDDLSISACGMLVVRKGSSWGWRSATVGEKMSDGVYFAQFMYFKASSTSDYDCLCGVLPTTSRNLNDYIYNINGGFCFNAYDGYACKKGNGSIPTGLSSCKGSSGPVVIGVMLNLDTKKIQFVVDGMESKTLDIEDEEYTFAVSLRHPSDVVKLLSIEQQSC